MIIAIFIFPPYQRGSTLNRQNLSLYEFFQRALLPKETNRKSQKLFKLIRVKNYSPDSAFSNHIKITNQTLAKWNASAGVSVIALHVLCTGWLKMPKKHRGKPICLKSVQYHSINLNLHRLAIPNAPQTPEISDVRIANKRLKTAVLQLAGEQC